MKTKARITKRTVLGAYLALLALAALSLWTSTLPLGAWAMPAALLFAAAKVAIVALVFMDLAEHGGGVRVVAITAPAFLALLLLAMLADVWLR